MRMTFSSLFSVILALSMFSIGAIADRVTTVYVTNLPLDTQGDLRTASVQRSMTLLVYNQSISVPVGVYDEIHLASFNTNGFKYAFIMAKLDGSWDGSPSVAIRSYDNNFGIRTVSSYLWLDISPRSWVNFYVGTGTSKAELHTETADLYLEVTNHPTTVFNAFLTVVVYLAN